MYSPSSVYLEQITNDEEFSLLLRPFGLSTDRAKSFVFNPVMYPMIPD